MALRLNANKFGLASGITSGIFYTLFSLIYAFFPEQCFKHCATLVYLVNYEKYMADFQFTAYAWFVGAITFAISSFIISWLFAYLYNAMLKKNE